MIARSSKDEQGKETVNDCINGKQEKKKKREKRKEVSPALLTKFEKVSRIWKKVSQFSKRGPCMCPFLVADKGATWCYFQPQF